MNSRFEQIHETAVKHVIDMLTDTKTATEKLFTKNKNNHSYRSIAHEASGMILTFPVLCSKNIAIQNSSMISKAIERQAVNLLQILFSAASISNAETGIEYLKQFHTNLGGGAISLDGFIDAMNNIVNMESATGIKINDKELFKAVLEDLKNINYYLPDVISENSVNDYKVMPQARYGEMSINKRNIIIKEEKEDKENKDTVNMFQTKIENSDVKKANELAPTLMSINFVSKKDGESTPIKVEGMIIGVKANLIPIDSSDVINRIISKNDDNNWFTKLVKVTTREISFWRDFVFAIDKVKADAIATSKQGDTAKLWRILERRSNKSKFRRATSSVNDARAITTLVISQEEAEYLKKNNAIDMNNARTARAIMESYNLMGLCIVDETMETASFMFDSGDDVFQTYPFGYLEREASDNNYKKIVNLMTKISR